MTNLHICFICNEYPPTPHGGLGTFVQNIARGLVKFDIKATVIGLEEIPKMVHEDDNGVDVWRLPKSKIFGFRAYLNAKIIQRKLKDIDGLNIVEGKEAAFAYSPMNTPYKKVVRLHGGHIFFMHELNKKKNRKKTKLEYNSLSKADSVVAVSNYVGEKTFELMKMNQDYVVIPNPVNVKLFTPSNEKIKKGKILFVGTITEKKGIKQLIDAFVLLINQGKNIELDIIGKDTIHPRTGISYIQYLLEGMKTKYRDKINVLGVISNQELPTHYATAEICVFPSHMESQGLVVLEAMAMGKAVIFSNLGPGPEIISDGINGSLCDPYSPISIAYHIRQLLENENKLGFIAKNAFKEVNAKYNLTKIIKENVNFYKSLVS